MAEPSPARLYATLVGALLLALGIARLLLQRLLRRPGRRRRGASASSPSTAGSTWRTCLTGAAGLLLAGVAPRRYALWLGCGYVAFAIWGFALGSGDAVLGFLPVDTAGDFLHLAVGVLGIGAALGTRVPRPAETVA